MFIYCPYCISLMSSPEGKIVMRRRKPLGIIFRYTFKNFQNIPLKISKIFLQKYPKYSLSSKAMEDPWGFFMIFYKYEPREEGIFNIFYHIVGSKSWAKKDREIVFLIRIFKYPTLTKYLKDTGNSWISYMQFKYSFKIFLRCFFKLFLR